MTRRGGLDSNFDQKDEEDDGQQDQEAEKLFAPQ
jgi:hypothetical protein